MTITPNEATEIAIEAVDAIIKDMNCRISDWQELSNDVKESIRQDWITLVTRQVYVVKWLKRD